MAKVYASGQMMRYFPEIRKNVKQLGRLCLVIGKSRLSVYTVFIVLAVVWVLSPLPSFAQHWISIYKGQYANFYYDSKSVKYSPDHQVQVLVKSFAVANADWGSRLLMYCQKRSNIAYENVQGEFSYKVDLFKLDCKAKKDCIISQTFYDKNGNILCEDPGETGWVEIKEFALARQLYQAVCK